MQQINTNNIKIMTMIKHYFDFLLTWTDHTLICKSVMPIVYFNVIIAHWGDIYILATAT